MVRKPLPTAHVVQPIRKQNCNEDICLHICLSVFLIFSFWFVYADSTCQNLEQWGRGWRRLRPKATLRFLVQQRDPESKSKVSGMERSQSASRKLLGGAPPAGFRGPRNHRPCKCSRGRGASQSARSGHDQNWSFRNQKNQPDPMCCSHSCLPKMFAPKVLSFEKWQFW